jgi:hypothetical protein
VLVSIGALWPSRARSSLRPAVVVLLRFGLVSANRLSKVVEPCWFLARIFRS